jgi:hypothetical protein
MPVVHPRMIRRKSQQVNICNSVRITFVGMIKLVDKVFYKLVLLEVYTLSKQAKQSNVRIQNF